MHFFDGRSRTTGERLLMSDRGRMSSGLSESGSAAQVQRVCEAFEAAWNAGERPVIEHFLPESMYPAPAMLLKALLCLDLAFRLRNRETPTPADYHPRFPGQAELIDAVFIDIPTMADSPQPTSEVASGPDVEPTDWTVPGYE